MSTSIKMVALELLEVVSPIMSTIKMKWKKGTILGVNNLQFKILGTLQKKPGATLPDLAQDRGLPIPVILTAVDDLIARRLVLQAHPTDDPQAATHSLTADGEKILHGIYEKSRTDLEDHLAALTAEERTLVVQALQLIAPLFAPNKEADENIEKQKDLWKAHA
ncbi:MAG: MarR family winged helix-turn-helix transcriptional regulator [Chloroflexota bacterium]